jgi:hypothetical protein
MPFNDDFMSKVMPAVGAYQGLPLQPSFVPGVPNIGLGGQAVMPPPAPADVPFGPPSPPPQIVPSGPVAPPVSVAGPIPPATMPDNRPIVTHTPGTPAHEMLTKGPTALGLENASYAERQAGNEEATRYAVQSQDERLHAAQKAYEIADAHQAGAQAAIAENQKKLMAANDLVGRETNARAADPITDYWADRGLGAKIGAALSIAVAGFGQAISGNQGPNPAMAILQADMDRDLRTKQLRFQQQTSNQNAKKDAAQQRFDNLAKAVGLDAATHIEAAAGHEKAAAQAEMLAAKSGIPEVMARGAKIAADLRAEADLKKADAVKLVQARAGGTQAILPGNPFPVGTPEFKAFEDRLKSQEEQSGKERVAEISSENRGDKRRQLATQFIAEKAQSADVPGTLSALDQAAAELKKGNSAGIGITGSAVKSVGGPRVYGMIYGKDAAQREQDWQMLSAQVMHTITGAGMSDRERERYDVMLNGAGTPEARAHAIAAARTAIVRKFNSIKAGAGVEAARAYDANLQELQPTPINAVPVK